MRIISFEAPFSHRNTPARLMLPRFQRVVDKSKLGTAHTTAWRVFSGERRSNERFLLPFFKLFCGFPAHGYYKQALPASRLIARRNRRAKNRTPALRALQLGFGHEPQ